jgi:hypothetical protein
MTGQPEPPLARTFTEAELYLAYKPCRVCGLAALKVRAFTYEKVGGYELDVIDTVCRNCGDEDEHPVRLPLRQVESTGGHLRYGGPEPSELFDPGDWLLLAAAVLADVPQEGLEELTADQRRNYRNLVDAALSAVEEALKFLGDGEAAVPADAFWSDAGHELYLEQPESFRRDRLIEQLHHHQNLLRRYEG